ncbi:MAG: hypothetical protein AAGF60_15740 [Pseudomonadota bacterium]
MWTRAVLGATLALTCGPAAAQEPPLSAIDWLSQHTPTAAAPVIPPVPEPPVTTSGAVPGVAVTPLGTEAPRRVGLVPRAVTGLPPDLWTGAEGDASARQLAGLRVPSLPAAQSLLYTLLFNEADPPASGADALILARIDTLMRLGALAPALELARQAGPQESAALFARFFDAALLAEAEDEACAILAAPQPPAAPYPAQIFCAARGGDWATAALLMGTASAVGEISQGEADRLARFLDPELFEEEPDLPPPARPDPLAARLLEAVGTPVATATWPRVYAHLDLRDVAGWKAQLAAAERLAETGALDANRLLGIFTERRPAASGGIWDRVQAIQRLDTALRTGSREAVAKTLPAAWRAAKSARLAVPLAGLFAEDVLRLSAGPDAAELVLLSPSYERAAEVAPDAAPLALGIAAGDTASSPAEGPMRSALRAGFAGAAPDAAVLETARGGALGPAILRTLTLLDQGARGDATALATALATLRALGLEDTARRAALQILLLDPSV